MTPQEQEAFNKGRLQGLKEMDEVWVMCQQQLIPDGTYMLKLRSEYRQE